jgi:hypothetical protein
MEEKEGGDEKKTGEIRGKRRKGARRGKVKERNKKCKKYALLKKACRNILKIPSYKADAADPRTGGLKISTVQMMCSAKPFMQDGIF